MRPSSHTTTDATPLADGGTVVPLGFDTAYRELAAARIAYEAERYDPARVPSLAAARQRLDVARGRMHELRAA